MKTLKIALFVTILGLAVTACSTQNQTMEKTESMESMKTDEMKKDTMKDEKMKEEKMKDDTMKDDTIHNSMKDEKEGMTEMKNEGEAAFDFSLKDKNDEVFTLSEQTGKKTYVKFWASWCSICLAGLEELNTLAGEENDFQIVTVVSPQVRGEKSKEDFIQWFDTLGYNNIKVLFDEDGKVVGDYGVRAYPTSAMIGSDGVLVKVLPGHIGADMLKETMAGIH